MAKRGPVMCALVLAASSALPGQQPDARVFPVFLNIEGEYVRTKMLLRLPYKAYAQQPVAGFAGPAPGADERTFLRFVESIRSNDLASLESVFAQAPAVTPGQDKSIVSVSPRSAAQTLALYRQSFGEFADVRVEGRVPLDDGALFVWSAGTAKGRLVRGSVVRSAGGRQAVSEVTMAQPLETFIVNSLNRVPAAELAGAASASVEPTNQSLPLSKSGIELRFSGTRMNTTIPGTGGLSGPLQRLAERIVASRDSSVERLLPLHTAKSAAKLKQWLGTMNREALAAYLADQARPRDVRLVVDGGPVVVVFSAPQKPVPGTPSQDVRYDYLVREGAAYRIANVLYESFFDDLMKKTTVVAAFLEGKPAPKK